MSAKRRLPLFYLIDSVCQVSKNKQQPAYRDLASKHLIDIILLVVPEEGEARDKAFPVVQKVAQSHYLLFHIHWFTVFYDFPKFYINIMKHQQHLLVDYVIITLKIFFFCKPLLCFF
jgi:hypothetical protein